MLRLLGEYVFVIFYFINDLFKVGDYVIEVQGSVYLCWSDRVGLVKIFYICIEIMQKEEFK